MSSSEDESWGKASKVRDKLVEELIHDPRVSLIDIGYDPAEIAHSKQIAVRVHFRRESDKEASRLPSEIDGIKIMKLVGDYSLE